MNLRVERDGANSLITEVEIGRGVAVVIEIFKRTASKRLVFRPLANTTTREPRRHRLRQPTAM